jgi:hypothetical protein
MDLVLLFLLVVILIALDDSVSAALNSALVGAALFGASVGMLLKAPTRALFSATPNVTSACSVDLTPDYEGYTPTKSLAPNGAAAPNGALNGALNGAAAPNGALNTPLGVALNGEAAAPNGTADDALAVRMHHMATMPKRAIDARARFDKYTVKHLFDEELHQHENRRWWDNQDLEQAF